jgi:hypothetical protein
MQTNSIKGKSIGVTEAVREMGSDMAKYGMRGVFRGQGVGKNPKSYTLNRKA